MSERLNWIPDWIVITFKGDMPLLRLQLRFCAFRNIAFDAGTVNG